MPNLALSAHLEPTADGLTPLRPDSPHTVGLTHPKLLDLARLLGRAAAHAWFYSEMAPSASTAWPGETADA